MYLFSPFLTSYLYNFLGIGNRLDAFIYDYLVKNQLYETARIFHDEGNVEQNIGKMTIRSFLGELNLLYAKVNVLLVLLNLSFNFGIWCSYGCTWWFTLRVVVCFLGIVYGQTRFFTLSTSIILP